MSTSLLLLAAAFLLILANGFFVAAEFGLVTVERSAAERAAEAGDRRARTVVAALRGLSFQLSGTQLGITITSLVVGMLAEPALGDLLAGPLRAAGLPAGAAPGVAVVVGMMAASGVQMVIGELVPKNWAVSRPLAVARVVAGPQGAFSRAFRPVIDLLNRVSNRLVRALGVEPADELASARTPTELVSLARHSALAGALEPDTADLFVRTMALGELTAENVMTPRVRVSALEDTATAADVLNLTRATGLSRFPVYDERVDDITGMVHLKDALAVPAEERSRTRVGALAKAPLLVPESLPVRQLLGLLRSQQPIAVVVDEYGGTAGLVTLEDIVEELVGEVRDEHDAADRPELARPRRGRRPAWTADGGTRVDTLERIGLAAPEGPYETVAGLVADLLGRIPAPGDTAALPGWRLRVEEVDHHRAARVRIVRTQDPAGEVKER
ncbi:hemolysin family protein [Actinacidiphila yeochonensis]|uniref:hemolysin family protein n=1 Tax=Actinacidiphila yeochonensis TaxID=89050 RepID=UPI00056A9544|nr:hemolysin family protein [Actinacidiphila yeochonensis]